MNYDTKNKESAFPITNNNINNGMTLRDYFAGQVLPTIAGRYENLNQNHDYIARLSYDLADAMIAVRGSKWFWEMGALVKNKISGIQ